MTQIIYGNAVAFSAYQPIRVAGYFYLKNEHNRALALNLMQNAVSEKFGRIGKWIFTDYYFDFDGCGENSSRPSMDKMLSDARADKFDLLLTDTIDRFADSADEVIQYIEELLSLEMPVRVYFLNDMLDSDTIHSILPILRRCSK